MFISKLPLLLVFLTTGFLQSDRNARPPQGGQETTRAGTELIQVCVVVADHDGQLVDGLTREDFLLTEDGTQQQLETFSLERSEGGPGSSLTAQREPAPGNPQGVSGQNVARNVVLLVDTAHITANAIGNVRTALGHFITERTTDRDQIAIMTSAGKPGTKVEFSNNRGKLAAEIAKTRPGYAQFESFLTPALCGKVVRRNPDAVSLAVLIIDSEERTSGSMVTPGAANPQGEAASKCSMVLLETASRRRRLTSAVAAAIDRLSSMTGQRIIALFSEGFSMIAPGGDIAISDLRPVVSAAARSGVMIYTFEAKIPLASKQASIEAYSLAGEILDAVRDLQHGTALLADLTGGEAFNNSDGLDRQLQLMLDNNRVHYRLAYALPTGKDPSKFRNINVSIKGHPDYRVRTQKGYAQRDLRQSK